ncbi:MAG: hypothetical protein AAGI71_06035, partial [Bacteroidota bacterium]
MSRLSLVLVASLFALLVATPPPASAQTPPPSTLPTAISVQGLATQDGQPLPNGTYAITLRLYTGPEGGTPLFEQTTLTPVQEGRFATTLDAPTLAFDEPYWLGVVFPGASSEELAPRTPLSTVPYSRRAQRLDPSALVAGDNVTIVAEDGALRISAAGGGGTPGVTSVTASDGVTASASTGAVALTLSEAGVTTSKLADAAVTTPKLADAAVTTSKLADGAITADKLAADVTGLADAAVTTAKIADAAVTTAKIAD